MKKNYVLLLSTVLAVGISINKSAFAASANGNGTATVVAALTISSTQDLAFGKISTDGSGVGTVVMTNAGVRSKTGGVVLVNTGSTQTAGKFRVTGNGTSTYAITLPAAAATITSGANTMTIDGFNSNPTGTGTLTAGIQDIDVGGTLNVANSQAAGDYTGTYTVIVEYN